MPHAHDLHLEQGPAGAVRPRQPPPGEHLALRSASIRSLQRSAGNAAVQRLLAGNVQRKPKSPGQTDKLPEEQEEEAVQTLQRLQRQAGQPLSLQRATTTFELTKPAPVRSNSASSTTQGRDPTFTGSVTKDDAKKEWGYKLDTVEAKGEIKIVYYTNDHYPAPTPEDDTGPLSNVTKANWRAIVKNLRKNRIGIADDWSAYLAEDLHEDYHWKDEWQTLVRAGIRSAERKIKKLGASFTGHATAADAEKVLKPQAATIFTAAMKRARRKWNKMGDDPGDPPYHAQAPAIDRLIKRVRAHATAQKWRKKKKKKT